MSKPESKTKSTRLRIRRGESSPRWPWAEQPCCRPPAPVPPRCGRFRRASRSAPAPGQPTEENMLYLKQLGVTWVSVGATPETANAEGFIKQREQWEAGGFKVYNIGSGVGPSGSLHNMPEVTLNLPGRDQKIEEYLNYIRYLGKAGIPYCTYAHMGNGIWRSGREILPRGYAGRDARFVQPQCAGNLGGKTLHGAALPRPRVHQRRDLGELHLLHQEGGPGGRGGGRAHRHPPGRSAAAHAGGRPALHLLELRGLQAGASRSPTVRTSACACAADPGWKAARTDRRRSGGDDQVLRRGRSSSRSTSATSARRCRISPRR